MTNSSNAIAGYALAAMPRRPVSFSLKTNVGRVNAVDDCIIGQWKSHPKTLRLDQTPQVLSDFANLLANAGSVSHFTKKYGPIGHRFESEGEFTFQVQDWINAQERFRRTWERLMSGRSGERYRMPWLTEPTRDDESFHISFGEIEYRVSTLERLLMLELAVQRPEKLAKCYNPECAVPFFFVVRKSQVYCSPECAEWGQRKAKRDWWEKEGKDRRAKKSG